MLHGLWDLISDIASHLASTPCGAPWRDMVPTWETLLMLSKVSV